jgi:hypothetical protein
MIFAFTMCMKSAIGRVLDVFKKTHKIGLTDGGDTRFGTANGWRGNNDQGPRERQEARSECQMPP